MCQVAESSKLSKRTNKGSCEKLGSLYPHYESDMCHWSVAKDTDTACRRRSGLAACPHTDTCPNEVACLSFEANSMLTTVQVRQRHALRLLLCRISHIALLRTKIGPNRLISLMRRAPSVQSLASK